MKTNNIHLLLIGAFIISLTGVICSILMPYSNISDSCMLIGIFSTAITMFTLKPSINNIPKSQYWRWIMLGSIMIATSHPVKYFNLILLSQMLFVTGSVIAIIALALHYYSLRFTTVYNTKWMIFFPMIFIGFVFKYMYWYGANIIIMSSLLMLVITSVIQFIKRRNYTLLPTLLLLWIICMSVCASSFLLRWIERDYFSMGSILIWLALLDLLLFHENNRVKQRNFKI